MIYITLIAVVALLFLELTGLVPRSSVGGAMTIALAFLLATLAAGIYEAWSRRRGVLGWIVNILVSVVGGFVAAGIGATLMDMLLPLLKLEGSLASTKHPMFYVLLAGQMILTMLGSSLALRLVNRFR